MTTTVSHLSKATPVSVTFTYEATGYFPDGSYNVSVCKAVTVDVTTTIQSDTSC